MLVLPARPEKSSGDRMYHSEDKQSVLFLAGAWGPGPEAVLGGGVTTSRSQPGAFPPPRRSLRGHNAHLEGGPD